MQNFDLPDILVSSIEEKFGKVTYTTSNSECTYSVTTETPTRYNAIQIKPDGDKYQVKAKTGFPELEQAKFFIIKQQHK